MIDRVLLLLADALAIVCFARALLQWAKLDYRQPLAQFCVNTTNWLIKPLRKIAPPLGQWDAACLLAVLLVYYLILGLLSLLGLPESHISAKIMAVNVLFTLLYASKAAAYVLLFGLVLRMVLSFSQAYSPLMPALQRIFEPLTRPFAFLRFGHLDFSATVLVLVLWLWLSIWLPQLMQKLNIWLLSS
ncbi:YggT family protein [Stenoxybacter acetivorans]|uniref:YggT family protein n=1 Tax=Stenoxybacter acetivorans TaxID=422441 RepID=UPI00056258DC|nr:YggT family protein [Stenoxybacter acetivorans]